MTDTTALHFTPEHEWVRSGDSSGDTTASDIITVGITDYAAGKLGDVVFVELPQAGAQVSKGTVIGEIESTKSVGELFAPADGEVTDVNQAVIDAPELVNNDPFGAGWLLKMRVSDLPSLLTHEEYRAIAVD